MKRLLVSVTLLLPLAACEKKATTPFEGKWAQVVQSTGDPLVIEGAGKGGSLTGEARRAVAPPVQDTPTALPSSTFPGPLPDQEVVSVIRHNLGGVKGCYLLAESEGVGSGKAIVNLEIDATGAVANVAVDAPAFEGSKLPACMSSRARSWSFPKFTEAPKRFSYPFVFAGG